MSSLNPNSCMGLEPARARKGAGGWHRQRIVVGIDVAKEKIDAAIRFGAEARLCQQRRGASRAVGVAERARCLQGGDGGQRRLREELGESCLREAGVEVVIVDPKRVRHFAKSAGQLAKNDPIDARMIAWFGEVFGHCTGQPHDEERQELDQLVTARLGTDALQGADRKLGRARAAQGRAKGPSGAAQGRGHSARQAGRRHRRQDRQQPSTSPERAEIIQSVPGLARYCRGRHHRLPARARPRRSPGRCRLARSGPLRR